MNTANGAHLVCAGLYVRLDGLGDEVLDHLRSVFVAQARGGPDGAKRVAC